MSKRTETKVLQIPKESTEEYWRDRNDINWIDHYGNLDHPHRIQLKELLKELDFDSILEVGCGVGANLNGITKKIYGIDINAKAIENAKALLPHGEFKVGMAESIDYPDKSIDLILTDACLINVPPQKIETAVSELLRVAKKYIVMCEWHFEKEHFNGHWVYDYKDLFKNYDVKFTKIKDWGGAWEEFGQFIVVEIKDEFKHL